MELEFSLKELYDVSLKATYNMDINGKEFQKGEVIAFFDKIQISNFQEIKKFSTASGGFDNRARVVWESTKELQLVFSQGIFSRSQFAIMTGSKMFEVAQAQNLYIGQRESLQTDDDGNFELKYVPLTENFFIINTKTGQKITEFTKINDKEFNIEDTLTDILVDYFFDYNKTTSVLKIGRSLTNGFLYLEGRTKTKDDITGQVKTGVIKIPKLKLMSELSMRLGENATPLVGTFKAVGYPVGERGLQEVMEIIFLEDDIDSDI